MPFTKTCIGLLFFFVSMHAHAQSLSANKAVALSQQWLLAVRQQEEATADSLYNALMHLEPQLLADTQFTQQHRLAFWINMYNGATIVQYRQQPALYKKRSAFFSKKVHQVAGQKLSLDDIEHHLLRRHQWKYGLGYLRSWKKPGVLRGWALPRKDARIHFALNCGAKSCPPVAFYDEQAIDRQLQLAQRGYLKQSCRWDSSQQKVYVSKIFAWFRGDFGGKRGIVKLLRAEGLMPASGTWKMRFTPYDWTPVY